MDRFKKRNVIIGLSTGIGSFILMFLIAWVWFGWDDLYHNDENRFVLLVFVPIWALILGFCGYYLSNKFYIQKKSILGSNFKNAASDNIDSWKNYRRIIYSNVFKTAGTIALFLVPVYVIALLDKSKYLASNLPFIIILSAMGIFCLIMAKRLKEKYDKSST